MPVTTHSPLAQRLLFALNFFRHPFMLGSIWPSSRLPGRRGAAARRLGAGPGDRRIRPGVGTITAEILRRMRPDAHLVAIETNEAFVKFLKSIVRRSAAARGQRIRRRCRPASSSA